MECRQICLALNLAAALAAGPAAARRVRRGQVRPLPV